jgi:hypothetical protein
LITVGADEGDVKMKPRFFFMVVGLVLVLVSYSFAIEVPKQMNYQGKLTSTAGAPVNDTVQMVFSIYADEAGTTPLWTETQPTVEILKGVFNVLLGSVNPIPYSVFDGSTRYLGVKVGGDPEITPRKPMVSVAYAYRAGAASDNDWVYPSSAGGINPRPYLYTYGPWGIARYGNTLYGNEDSTHVNLGVACTTGASGHNYKYCTVAGGLYNTASNAHATVGGGWENTANNLDATVGGGYSNTASGSGATVGGGGINTASGYIATVGGGAENTASGPNATVGGGYLNTASGDEATVGGGYYNHGIGAVATVGGGRENTASGVTSTVGGGAWDTASGEASTVGGGFRNAASGYAATVGGGDDNTASSWSATAGGGHLNTASGSHATVGGGEHNAASGDHATVGGGDDNTASGDHATAGGGESNIASGWLATVGGGYYDTASGYTSTIGGGYYNTVTNSQGTIAGGGHNYASGGQATIAGGYYNTAGPYHYSTVGGGERNTASNYYSTVPGGYGDTASGYCSIAAGYQVRVNADYTLAFGYNFTTSASHAVIFHDTGTPIKVGIGTTSPSTTLHVQGDAIVKSTGGSVALSGTDGSMEIWGTDGAFIDLKDSESDDYDFRITQVGGTSNLGLLGGNVGIGHTSPTEKLDVNGTARLRSMSTGTGTDVVVDANGVLLKKSSSIRYKQNIRRLDSTPDQILQLNPVRFDWKTTGEADIGLIAEEVEKAVPDLVIYDKEGKPDAVKYDKMTVYLLQVVKAQQEQIDVLKAKLEKLESTK